MADRNFSASAEKAKQRIATITSQLSPSTTPASSPSKVAIITGADSPQGIGIATARRLASSRTYRALYLCDIADTHLTAHKNELETSETEVHTRSFDASDEEAVKDAIAHAIETYGRLDVFFANAGTTGRVALFTDITTDEFMKCMQVNAQSVFVAIKHASPAMQITSASKPQASGSIIATASVAGLRSNAGPMHYSAAKAAVVNLVQTAAYQLTGTGVRVNAVCPGLIRTGMTEAVWDQARARGTEAKIGQLNPTRRAGGPDEVAAVAEFLAGEGSSYINGQAWAVDGGLSAGLPFAPGKMH